MVVVHQGFAFSFEDDPSVFEHIGPVTHSQRLLDVLLNQENRHTFLIDPPDHVKNFLNQNGREAEGRLIKHHQLGKGHEPPADGKHLLLSPGKGAGHLFLPFPEPGEKLVDLLHRLETFCLRVAVEGPHDEVFRHTHFGKEAPSLGNMDDSLLDDFVGKRLIQPHPIELDASLLWRDQGGNGPDRRRLPRAVGPYENENFLLLHVKGDVPQDLEVPVKHVNAVNLEHTPLRDRLQ